MGVGSGAVVVGVGGGVGGGGGGGGGGSGSYILCYLRPYDVRDHNQASSSKGVSAVRHQATIWPNADLLWATI